MDRLDLTNEDRNWTADALCKGRSHLFFAPPRERPGARVRRETLAKRYCLVCPVMEECRDYARTNRENGFWGGETEEERAAAGHAPRSITRRAVSAARDTAVAS